MWGLWKARGTMSTWQVIQGDCLTVLPTLTGVDAVITDPPYGVQLRGKRTKRKASLSNTGYSNLADEPDVVRDVAVPCVTQCIKMFGRVVVMPGVRNMFMYPTPADVGGVFNPAGAGMGRWGFCCVHPILYYGKCPYLANGRGSRPNGFKDIAAGEKVDGHPCPKPIRWMTWLIERATNPGDTVLDPFCGSGTTGVACVQTGRNFIGIELDAGYCEIARRRIADAVPICAGGTA